MALADLTLIITNHAYQQYCDRVKQIDRGELHEEIAKQLIGHKERKGDFLKMQGVWWVFLIEDEELRFVTCYGQSTFDIPQALEWARRHGDRIKLGERNA